MGKRTETVYTTTIIDDLDGKTELPEDTEPVRLVHEGKDYDLYLTDVHAKELVAFLDKYTANAEPVGKSKPAKRGGTTRKTPANSDVEVIRAWARTQPGLTVKDKGRISGAVREAYQNRDK